MSRGLIRIILLSIFAGVGIPLNLGSFIVSVRQCRRAPSRTLLVQIQRSVIDFLFISIYVSTQIYSTVSDYWMLGEPMCKAAYFLRHFCFSLSSNLIVCIAIDRWHLVTNLTQVRHFRPIKGMVLMLTCAWVLSILIALPTIFVKRSLTIFGTYTYCTFIWVQNETSLLTYYIKEPPIYEKIWTFYDIFSKFWIPMTLVIGIYVRISLELRKRLQGFENWAQEHPMQATSSLSIKRLPRQTSCHSATDNLIRDDPPSMVPIVMTKRQSEPMVIKHSLVQTSLGHARRVFDPAGNRTRTSGPSGGGGGFGSRKQSMATQWRGAKLMKGGMYLAAIIIGVHALFCMPYSLLALVVAFDRQSYLQSSLSIFDMMVIAGSVVNPIVYRNCLR